jgi:hypothetical protein
VAYLAAAVTRTAGRGGPPWSLIVTNASPAITADEAEIRILTRDGRALRARARHKFDSQTKYLTTVLEGLEPLVEIGLRAN